MSGKERALQSIREKLQFSHVKPETLVCDQCIIREITVNNQFIFIAQVHLCEKLDRNRDDLLNTEDLYDILRDKLGPSTLTQREMKYLSG